MEDGVAPDVLADEGDERQQLLVALTAACLPDSMSWTMSSRQAFMAPASPPASAWVMRWR